MVQKSWAWEQLMNVRRNEYSGAVQGFQFHAYLSKEENEYIEVFVHRPK